MSRSKNKKEPDNLEGITDILRDNVLIVEGKKDKSALYCLGLKNIIAINGRPLAVVAEEAAVKSGGSVVILTDFDRAGKKQAARLCVLLQRLRVQPNARLRGMIMSFGKNKIEDFNAGNTVPADFNRGDFHVKIGANVNKIRNNSTHKSKGNSREA